jgi:DNA-directed RNA polymerase subunit RPC12/RpoP
MNPLSRSGDVPDTPHVGCPWCGGSILLSKFARSDEEIGTDVAVCPHCGKRVPLALPQELPTLPDPG